MNEVCALCARILKFCVPSMVFLLALLALHFANWHGTKHVFETDPNQKENISIHGMCIAIS